MKLILMGFAVLLVALIVNGFPAEEGKEDLDMYFDLIDSQLTESLADEQPLDCVLVALLKVFENNPDLKAWLDEVQKTIISISEGFANCAVQSGLRLDLCFLKFKPELEKEVKRVIDAMPEDKKHLWKSVGDDVMKCFA